MGFIQDWFNERAKSKLQRQEMAEILAAIKAKNIPSIKETWGQVKDKTAFMSATTFAKTGGFNTHVYSRLLIDAMDADDVDVFKAVFEQNPDPNYVVSQWASGDFAKTEDSYDPILALAIKSGKGNVALYLAEQPGIKKDVVGHKRSSGLMWSDNSSAIDPVPLELARTSKAPGMKDVFYSMVKLNFPRSSTSAVAAQDLRPRI